jgi:hypothetical protein
MYLANSGDGSAAGVRPWDHGSHQFATISLPFFGHPQAKLPIILIIFELIG